MISWCFLQQLQAFPLRLHQNVSPFTFSKGFHCRLKLLPGLVGKHRVLTGKAFPLTCDMWAKPTKNQQMFGARMSYYSIWNRSYDIIITVTYHIIIISYIIYIYIIHNTYMYKNPILQDSTRGKRISYWFYLYTLHLGQGKITHPRYKSYQSVKILPRLSCVFPIAKGHPPGSQVI